MSGATLRKVLQFQTQNKEGESERRWTEIPKEAIDGQTRKKSEGSDGERTRDGRKKITL